MIRSHVIKLDPTCKQKAQFRQAVGTARFAFNWALNQWRTQYAAGDKPSEGNLRKQLNAVKETEFPWMLNSPKSVVQQAVKNLGIAYQNFFASCKGTRAGKKMCAPDFKSKHTSKQSARFDNGPDTFSCDGKSIKLPKVGTVKMHEALRFDGKPLSAVVSFVGGRWWVSVQVEIPDKPIHTEHKPSVGIDLGLITALTLSTGEKFYAPKPLKAALEKLRRLQQNLARKVKGSANRKKAALLVARCHWRVGQIRKDWQHKITGAIDKRFGLACVEDLNVRGMMTNHCLARSIADIGWSEIGRQLQYKCDVVQEVGRFFPSSKLCSSCGVRSDDVGSLNVRAWSCTACGATHDRDQNAAINILNEGCKLFAASCAVSACGGVSSGPGRKTKTKLVPTKQELSSRLNATL